MKNTLGKSIFGILVIVILVSAVATQAVQPDAANNKSAQVARDYPIKPVPFTAVHFNDVFWPPRIETNRAVTIPFAFEQCEKSGRMDNFDRAAAVLRGEEVKNKKAPGFPFDDTDPYKVLEGASYALAVKARSQDEGIPGRAYRPDRRRHRSRTDTFTPRAPSIPSIRTNGPARSAG